MTPPSDSRQRPVGGMVEGIRTVRSYCRICQAHCGLMIDVDGNRIVRVSGDEDHPVSRGYTCSKGRALAQIHHADDGLEEPLLRGTPCTWDEVLADLAHRFRALVDEHGPNSIACYRSTGWVLDTNGRSAVDRWIRALGTRQIYSPSTIDTPNRMLVPDLMVGAPFLQPVVDWDHTRLLLVLGQNVVVSHGHATAVPDPVRRIRAIQERGGSVIVADPRRTETARLADVHLQIYPGSDVALAAFLVGHRLRTRPDAAFLERCADPESLQRLGDAVAAFDRDSTARLCGVDAELLDRTASLVERTDRLSYVSGTGVSMGPAANAAEWLGWALSAVSGSLDRQGGLLFNPGVIRPQSETGPSSFPRITGAPPASRPQFVHAYGEYPSAVLCDEILAGNVRALICFGGNPVASFPDSSKTTEAFGALDVLAVAELRHTQTTEMATHLLPTCDQLERHDVTFFMDQAFPIPFAQYTAPVVEPRGNRRPLWRMMADLAGRMGMDVPRLAQVDNDEAMIRGIVKRSRVPFDALKAAPSGVVVEEVPRHGWFIPDRVPKGRVDLAPDPLVNELRRWVSAQDRDRDGTGNAVLRLICRRLPHQMNSDLQEVPSQQRPPFATLLISEIDAERRGISDGDVVTVATSNGSTEAVVEITDRIRPGVVSLPHSWRSPAVNNLTSAAELEPMTGMPLFTAITVSVSRDRSGRR